MLSTGNSKLGRAIASWSLPVKSTCPGASAVCAQVCYAKRGFYHYNSVRKSLQTNQKRWQSPTWTDDIVAWLHKQRPLAVRIHAAGDFHREIYIDKWHEIVSRCNWLPFYAYTRSWVIPELRKKLVRLSRLRNMHLWYSGDQSMPAPPKTPGIRRAYLRLDADDFPRWKPDLIFNESKSKFAPEKRVQETLVCPAEQRIPRKFKITCDRCRLCFGTQLNRLYQLSP